MKKEQNGNEINLNSMHKVILIQEEKIDRVTFVYKISNSIHTKFTSVPITIRLNLSFKLYPLVF